VLERIPPTQTLKNAAENSNFQFEKQLGILLFYFILAVLGLYHLSHSFSCFGYF
jgi:hypothetical protein